MRQAATQANPMRTIALQKLIDTEIWLTTIVAVIIWGMMSQPGYAQREGVTIENGSMLSRDRRIVWQLRQYHQQGQLTLKHDQVKEQLDKPLPEKISLPTVSQEQKTGGQVYETARKALVRIGYARMISSPNRWSFNIANGYAIAENGIIATCHHCIAPDDDVTEAWLIAVTADERVYPVTSVIAANERMDTAIVKVEGLKCSALPLNDQVSPGDVSYLLSDPFGVRGYFSTGIVNRFYWQNVRNQDPQTLFGAASYRINLSTEWAPGSSGAAVLDTFGNAIGHVATISPLSEQYFQRGFRLEDDDESDKNENTLPKDEEQLKEDRYFEDKVLITLHEAVPARAVRLLAESVNEQLTKKQAELVNELNQFLEKKTVGTEAKSSDKK